MIDSLILLCLLVVFGGGMWFGHVLHEDREHEQYMQGWHDGYNRATMEGPRSVTLVEAPYDYERDNVWLASFLD